MTSADTVYQSLLTFLDARGGAGAAVRQQQALLEERIRRALGVPLQVAAQPEEIDGWSQAERTKANIRVLRILRDVKAGQHLTPEDRATLLEYSGWGGVKPEEVPASVLPDDVRAELDRYKAWYDNAAIMGASRAGPPPAIPSLAGIVTQYFTPHYIAVGMWQLVQRLGFSGGDALEPSAGVGRFLRMAPTDLPIRWSVVEMDGIENTILGHAFPDAEHHVGTFESYVRAINATPRFNLIIGNPPYARHAPYAGQDGLERSRKDVIKYEHDYFVDRCSRLLLPGGTLCLLIPAGYATQTSEERVELRRALAKRCHIDTILFLPSRIFSGANLTTMVIVATRRGRDLAEILPEDEAFVNGTLRNQYPENSLGVWQRTNWRGLKIEGEDDGGYELVWPKDPAFGLFTPDRIAGVTLRPLPTRELDHIRDALETRAAEDVAVWSEGDEGEEPREVAKPAVVLSTATQEAALLSARLEDYLTLVAQEPTRAEQGREEILADVQAWVQRHGNPHDVVTVDRKKANVRAFLGMFSQDGAIAAPALTQPVAAPQVDTYVGDPEDIGALVAWIARTRGYATFADLMAVVPHADMHERALRDPTVAVEFITEEDADGLVGWIYYPWDEYLVGNLWPRHDRCVAMLAHPEVTEELRGRYNRQLSALLDVIKPARYVVATTEKVDPLAGEIDVSIRSGFVGLDTLAAYLTERDEVVRGKTMALEIVDGYLREVNALGGQVTRNLLAYWNREDDVGGADNKTGRTSRFTRRGLGGKTEQIKDAKEKIDQDGQLEEDFTAWLRNDEAHLRSTLDRYNRLYRGQEPRTYSEAPLSIFRLRNVLGKTSRPHQNSTLRRLERASGGLVAHDVGLGKTHVGYAFVALMRQKGRCRRPMIVMPNSVLINWWRETREWLPDYNIVTIGQTIRPDGTVKDDDKETRAAKWRAVQAGVYDLVLCPYSLFLSDVQVRPDTRYEILSKEYWLLRQQSIDNRDRETTRERVTDLKSRITELEVAIQAGTRFVWSDTVTLITREEKQEKLATLIKELRGIDGATLPPADRMRLREAMGRYLSAKRALLDLQGEVAAAEAEEEGAKAKRKKKGKAAPDARVVQAAEADVAQEEAAVKALADELGVLVNFDATRMPASLTVRNLEVTRQEAEEWIQNRTFNGAMPLVFWEDLGIDLLTVDEAHNFKNLWYAADRYGSSIRFLASGDKQVLQAWDLYTKAAYLRARNNDANVLLLTATPLKNSPLELYTMLSYVSSRVWADRDILTKEAFIDRYIRIETTETLSAKRGFQNSPTALAYKNLGELYAIGSLYIDVRTARDVNASAIERAQKEAAKRGHTLTADEIAAVPLPLPVPRERAHPPYKIPMTEEQYAVYAVLRDEAKKTAEDVKGSGGADGGSLIIGGTDAGDDEDAEDEDDAGTARKRPAKRDKEAIIAGLLDLSGGNPRARLLKLMDRMSKAAVDLYLIDPDMWATDIPNKAMELAKKIGENPTCGHIVFIDYNELHPRIADIIAEYGGVDRSRIAYISGKTGDAAARQAVADRFTGIPDRPGQPGQKADIDILIGQSKVIGEGMNLQARTCALHHYTFPWEPATIRQRNGRGVRQGNAYQVVDVHYYLSMHSFDIFRWDMIQGKLAQQTSLFAPNTDDVANPMAGARMSIEELLVAFEPDPRVAAKMLADLQEERQKRVRIAQVQDVRRKVGRLALAWISIRRQRAYLRAHPNPGKEKQLGVDVDVATRLTNKLLEYDEEAVPPQLRQMLMALPTTNALWHEGRNLAAVEGEAITGLPRKKLYTHNKKAQSTYEYGTPVTYLVTTVEPGRAYVRARGTVTEKELWPRPMLGGDAEPDESMNLVGAINAETAKLAGLTEPTEAQRAALALATERSWDAALDAKEILANYTPRDTQEYYPSVGYQTVSLAPGQVDLSTLLSKVPEGLIATYRDILWRNAYTTLLHTLRLELRTFALKEDALRLAAKAPEKGAYVTTAQQSNRRALTTVIGFADGRAAVVAFTMLQYLLLPADSKWRGRAPLLPTASDRRKLMAAIDAQAVTTEAGEVVSRTRMLDLASAIGVSAHHKPWPSSHQPEIAESLTSRDIRVSSSKRIA